MSPFVLLSSKLFLLLLSKTPSSSVSSITILISYFLNDYNLLFFHRFPKIFHPDTNFWNCWLFHTFCYGTSSFGFAIHLFNSSCIQLLNALLIEKSKGCNLWDLKEWLLFLYLVLLETSYCFWALNRFRTNIARFLYNSPRHFLFLKTTIGCSFLSLRLNYGVVSFFVIVFYYYSFDAFWLFSSI